MEKNKKIAVSACLLGIPCRWDAQGKYNQNIINQCLNSSVVIICPEILAGLTTPRPACEIIGGDGNDVLNGQAKIVDKNNNNYTKIFIDGATKALKILKQHGIKTAILKSGSPSCGAGTIYDGFFSGTKKPGIGIFTALLKKSGVKVIER